MRQLTGVILYFKEITK